MYQHEQDLLREYGTLVTLLKLLRVSNRSIREVLKKDGDCLDETLVTALMTLRGVITQIMNKGVKFSDGTFTVGIIQHLKDVQDELQVLQVGKPTKEPTNRKEKDNGEKK